MRLTHLGLCRLPGQLGSVALPTVPKVFNLLTAACNPSGQSCHLPLSPHQGCHGCTLGHRVATALREGGRTDPLLPVFRRFGRCGHHCKQSLSRGLGLKTIFQIAEQNRASCCSLVAEG